VVQLVVKAAQARIEELQEWGVAFDTNKNQQLHLALEGGHSEKRIVHHKDQTGKAVQEALLAKAQTLPNIHLLAEHILVDLITEHHLPDAVRSCYGAYVISKSDQKVFCISSRITVLSTGGGGQLYAQTSNPKGATADGLGAAYRAKVPIKQLPYVQFHPTVMYSSQATQPLLLTEALRGAGALLRNAAGEALMTKYHPQKDLAPRDIVARAIANEIASQSKPFVYLDCSSITKEKFQTAFPNIFNSCKSLGILLPKQWIPVGPAAHYFCGGIAVDSNGQSGLQQLFAIGECSCTGLHGANRLASNSLLESLVYAHRAALKSVALLKNNPKKNPPLPNWNGAPYINKKPSQRTLQLKQQLQQIMVQHMGIFKNNAGLKQAKKELLQLYKTITTIYHQTPLTPTFCELRNMIGVAHLMVEQAQQITANSGTFYNYDYAK
jgi:L-aspartate oxidase